MPARRNRLGRGDKVVVTSPYGSRLGTYDLETGLVTDVPPAFRDTFVAELDEWLTAHGLAPFPGFGPGGAPVETPSRRQRVRSRVNDTLGFPRPQDGAADGERVTAPVRRSEPMTPALEAGVPTPAGGWSADSADGYRFDAFDDGGPQAAGHERSGRRALAPSADLARYAPDHGLARAAAEARRAGRRDEDKALRQRADARHEVAAALSRELAAPVSSRLGRAARWRMLHGIDMRVGGETVTLDHLILCPSGVFVVEDRPQPGGKVIASTDGLEVDGQHIDLARIRTLAEEAADRLAEGIALAAGFEEVLNPPAVTPVVVVVGATIVNHSRPRGVVVTRPGDLARALRSRGDRLTPAAVEETFAVARRSDTWLS
ncbi:nuclease-related domain-containing protein [Actinomycetospora termitidis]|uniref:Nuclease-related domain-containing protein n=1 Tax=Actinomycetospora termitidis TaxID=3053470 RepID=A0ABT7M6S5_9PSEU|nr:nuclease-related domain-containing protein [Actinomycetospora sp. Odt1-22]MDL5155158.1 nuclease-related domain-containing protein [Actinomycetospora sp. Odt1-22]